MKLGKKLLDSSLHIEGSPKTALCSLLEKYKSKSILRKLWMTFRSIPFGSFLCTGAMRPKHTSTRNSKEVSRTG